jgi:hypothetical protein
LASVTRDPLTPIELRVNAEDPQRFLPVHRLGGAYRGSRLLRQIGERSTGGMTQLTVLHLHEDFKVISEITGRPVERLVVSST